MYEELTGTWSGLMLDAEGRRARLEVNLEPSDGELSGDVRYSMINEESVQESRGRVKGTVEDGRVRLYYELEAREGSVSVEFTGTVQPVKHHAEATLYGTYRVTGADSEMLSGGVVILWQYAEPR